MSWRALPPELARVDLLGLVYLGTLRGDGRPRLGPAEAHVWEGELLIGVMPRSLRARDLARDPRCTLQSAVAGPDSGDPELKLYCRAEPAAGEPPDAWWSGREDAAVYALDVNEAALVEWDLERGLMTVMSWSPARGLRTECRSYP
ncbi:MAG: hypothetical protein ICV67_07195 [Thermoleophilia bacterium]|nr:hypothetical protein [Thermoleophilia bacterium]